MKKLLIAFALGLLLVPLAHAPDVLAQNFGLDAAAGNSIPKTKEIATIIGRILRTALGFVGTLFLLLMVYAGFLYMTAAGDSKKVDQAKQLIVGAIIGVVIIASAYAITGFVLTAATGQGGSADTSTETPVSENSSCLPSKCVNHSDCGDTSCYTGVCRCVNGGSPPCDDAGGQDGQCVMK